MAEVCSRSPLEVCNAVLESLLYQQDLEGDVEEGLGGAALSARPLDFDVRVLEDYGVFEWNPDRVPTEQGNVAQSNVATAEEIRNCVAYEVLADVEDRRDDTRTSHDNGAAMAEGETAETSGRNTGTSLQPEYVRAVADMQREIENSYENTGWGPRSRVFFEKKLPPDVRQGAFTFLQSCPRVVPLFVAEKRGLDLSSVDFLLGGSFFQTCGEADCFMPPSPPLASCGRHEEENTCSSKGTSYLVENCKGTTVINKREGNFFENRIFPTYQLKRWACGHAMSAKHGNKTMEHLRLLKIGPYRVLMSASVDALCPTTSSNYKFKPEVRDVNEPQSRGKETVKRESGNQGREQRPADEVSTSCTTATSYIIITLP
ncbi:unnamed protein product [Amoebophrya sp. A25]|nr:unnamed protein product [Amoebophrya sp. A25]|eukprot:GSA25T00027199001.1